MTTPNPTPTTVQVPVPTEHLGAVYRLLADLSAGITSSQLHGDTSPDDDADPDWTVDEFVGLLRDKRVSFVRICKVMDVLAKSPGQRVALSELVTETGLTNMNIRGALSGFSRSLNSTYGEIQWPMEFSWGHSDTQQGEAYYKLDQETAERWREAKRQHRGR